jgi:hypothetical protein
MYAWAVHRGENWALDLNRGERAGEYKESNITLYFDLLITVENNLADNWAFYVYSITHIFHLKLTNPLNTKQ